MFYLLSFVSKNHKISINGRVFSVKAMARYVTQKKPDEEYLKMVLDDGHVLVVCPSDGFMYFGRNMGSVGVSLPPDDEISYNGKKYRQIACDYQIMTELVFGSVLDIEGEVEFWDYECVDDPKRIISMALVCRTKERADVVAQIIGEKDVKSV